MKKLIFQKFCMFMVAVLFFTGLSLPASAAESVSVGTLDDACTTVELSWQESEAVTTSTDNTTYSDYEDNKGDNPSITLTTADTIVLADNAVALYYCADISLENTTAQYTLKVEPSITSGSGTCTIKAVNCFYLLEEGKVSIKTAAPVNGKTDEFTIGNGEGWLKNSCKVYFVVLYTGIGYGVNYQADLKVDISVVRTDSGAGSSPSPVTGSCTTTVKQGYSVTYNANGGNFGTTEAGEAVTTKVDPVLYAIGSTVTVKGTGTDGFLPTRENYAFTGWNRNANGTGTEFSSEVTRTYQPKETFSVPISGCDNMTLYAQWKENPKVTFDANGGSFSDGETTKTVYADKYGKFSTLPTPTRTGYTFDGWYTAAEDGDKVTTDKVFDDDNTVYAHWTVAQYSITYLGVNGADNSANPGGYNITTETFTLKSPTMEGYAFLGWTGEGNDTLTKVVTITEGSTGDRTYTANWQKLAKITFDAKGGRCDTEYEYADVGGKLSSLPTPTMVGFRFTGWYTEDGAQVTTDTEFSDDTTVYAHWRIDSETLLAIGAVSPDNSVIMMPAQDTAAFDTALDTYKLQLLAGDTGFSDVAKTDWFYGDVTSLATKGVVSGYPDGTFLPYGEVTWGEALKLVLKAVGYECAATSDHWASGYMDKAIELGYITGEVDLNAAITRGEMADLVAAAMKLGAATIASPFADDAPASAVALYEAGIIKGSADNGQLLYRADSTITRAEISAIIWRMVKAR